MYVIFDKNNNFVGYSDNNLEDFPNLEIFKMKIPEEQSDLTEWWWEGDMLTGRMVRQNFQENT
jgi:hypothetical protein